MKCKLLRDMDRLVEVKVRGKVRKQVVVIPKGTELDHEEAWMLCDLGVAEPLDDECREYAKPMTTEQQADAAKNYEMMELGLHPEDRDLYLAGKIAGYSPDFDPLNDPPSKLFLPGPNWTDADAAAIDAVDDDADGEDEEEATEPKE